MHKNCEFVIRCLFFLLFFVCGVTHSQSSFVFPAGVKKDKIQFKFANNLMVVPMILNGVELSFILDTGVGSTILFGIDEENELELNNASKILLRGLGKDESVEAIKSTQNVLQIGDAYSSNHTVYVVFDKSINFSPRMGFPIHGVIGYDFFRKFVTKINFDQKILTFTLPKYYKYRKNCKKCYQTELDFSHNIKKPYVKLGYMGTKGLIDINLLLDSGSGSSIWLFANEEKGLTVPENAFEDFLGKGFNGDIYGKKTKINSLFLGDFELKNVTAAFPDVEYLQGIPFDQRQGSLGGGVLRRFNCVIDYPRRTIRFKKNRWFSKPFHYNMSGLVLQHSGVRIYQEYNVSKRSSRPALDFIVQQNGEISNSVYIADVSSFKYTLQPEYQIVEVRKGSPSYEAGIRKGDVVTEVNGRKAHEYSLSKLNDLFYSEEGKRIRIKIERNHVAMQFTFKLRKVL